MPPPERTYQQTVDMVKALRSYPGGLMQEGNIDIDNRPVVHNPDGSISTVRSMSANFDGEETLIPTVSPEGTILSDDDAVDLYRRTGQHLGKFVTPEAATDYARILHDRHAQQYKGR